jgi:Arabinogalactan endo-1,4-beta-galactosidase
MFRSRGELPAKFETGDNRAKFFTKNQTQYLDDITNQSQGYFMTKLVTGSKAIDGCLGVFYWEPECYNSWEGYSKGVFDNSGKATSTLNIFKQ